MSPPRWPRQGDGRGAPQLVPGVGVETDDIATLFPIAAAPGQPRHHLAIGDDRPARELVADALVDVRVPDLLAGARVDRHHVRIRRVQEDLVVVHRDVAVHAAGGRPPEAVAGSLGAPLVLPDEVASGGVERVHDLAGIRDVQHPVVHQGGRLLRPRPQRPAPDQPQLADVAGVDLIQGAVRLTVEGAPPAQPVGRVRVLQHRVGHRRVVLDLRRRGRGGEHDGDQRRSERESTGHGTSLSRKPRGSARGNDAESRQGWLSGKRSRRR